MSAIGSIAGTLLHAVLPVNLFPNNTTAASVPLAGSASPGQPANAGRLPSFAQVVGTLQQLQQSNPAQYQQVMQQISANLKGAAQTAQSGGDTAAASQLGQLSSDFSSASASGQLPNLHDLAKALGSSGHRHLHGLAEPGSATESFGQFLASAQSGGNAATIIQNTLAGAGVGSANG